MHLIEDTLLPSKSGWFLNSQLFCCVQLELQTSNVAGIVKSVYFLCWQMLQVIFTTNQRHYLPCSAGIQRTMNLLEVRWDACMGDG